MTDTNDKELNIDPDELEEPEEILDEDGVDTTDWKALAQKHFGIAKRYRTKFKKMKDTEDERVKTEAEKADKQTQDKKEEKKDFDYAEKAYLKAMGIEKEEFPFVLDAIKSTGKSLDEILDSKYFQAELKEKREEKDSKDAIPKGTKRSGGAVRNEVEYWLAKGELPPEDQVQLRRDVVNAKLKVIESKSKFTDTPVVK